VARAVENLMIDEKVKGFSDVFSLNWLEQHVFNNSFSQQISWYTNGSDSLAVAF
jgi:hypothetical protein